MPILVLLPALSYAILTLALYKKNFAYALTQAHLLVFIFIAVSTEVLSFFHAIRFSAILTAWILFLLLCGLLLALRFRRGKISLPAIRFPAPADALLLTGIFFLLAAALAAAWLYPPNTWDSLTYHLARVVHWIKNESVSFYPTSITRQLYQMPLAEYGILHLQILSGGDRFAGMIQWVAYLVSICLAALVAAEFGLDARRQLLSAAVMASVPMAVLQASSTQNDLIVSSFIFAFAFFLLRMVKRRAPENTLFAALAFGLALFTKATAFVYSAGVGIALGVAALLARKDDQRELLQTVAALALIVFAGLAIGAPHLWRNYRAYGNPLSTESDDYSNKDLSLRTLGGNLLRNTALHLGVPFESINAAQYRALEWALGSELNNPATTWKYSAFQIPYSRDETLAGNLLHALAALAGIILLPIYWTRSHDFTSLAYATGAGIGYVIYCWMLNWQLWASRLHLPLFALSAPLVALMLSSLNRRRVEYIFAWALLLYALPYAVNGANRPLLTLEWRKNERAQLYFHASNPALYYEYAGAINSLGDFKGEVGLLFDMDSCEYPLWVFAGQATPRPGAMTFVHVGAQNVANAEVTDAQPEYVIAAKELKEWGPWRRYDLIYDDRHIRVYRKTR